MELSTQQLQIGLKPVGLVNFTVRDSAGRIVRRHRFRNAASNHLRSSIAQWLVGVNNTGYNPVAPPSMIALGTGTGTTAAQFVEVPGTRKACSSRMVVAGYYAQYTTVYTVNDPTGTFTQAALMDAAGNIWAVVQLAYVSKQPGETLTGVWKVLMQAG